MSSELTRKYQCKYYTVYARPNSCFFCDNCTDIFYDYEHGYASPYMWLCDKGNDTEVGMMGKCQDFYEDAEQTEPQTVLEAVLERQTDEDRRKMEESIRKAIKDEQTEREGE